MQIHISARQAACATTVLLGAATVASFIVATSVTSTVTAVALAALGVLGYILAGSAAVVWHTLKDDDSSSSEVFFQRFKQEVPLLTAAIFGQFFCLGPKRPA